MPSADFRIAVRSPLGFLSPLGTRCGSPEVSSTTFAAHLPDLHPEPFDGVDFASWGTLVQLGLPHIRFLFVRSQLCSTLLSGFPLRFANTSSPSDCVKDFHLLVVEHARHTPQGTALPSRFGRTMPAPQICE